MSTKIGWSQEGKDPHMWAVNSRGVSEEKAGMGSHDASGHCDRWVGIPGCDFIGTSNTPASVDLLKVRFVCWLHCALVYLASRILSESPKWLLIKWDILTFKKLYKVGTGAGFLDAINQQFVQVELKKRARLIIATILLALRAVFTSPKCCVRLFTANPSRHIMNISQGTVWPQVAQFLLQPAHVWAAIWNQECLAVKSCGLSLK